MGWLVRDGLVFIISSYKFAIDKTLEPPMEAQSSGSAFAQWKERRRAAKALGGCCGKKTTC